jgi:hypothetical protein
MRGTFVARIMDGTSRNEVDTKSDISRCNRGQTVPARKPEMPVVQSIVELGLQGHPLDCMLRADSSGES